MPYRRESTAVLARWRTVEREMLAAPLGSPEFERHKEEWARLRLEYGRLTDLIANRPPTPMPPSVAASDGSPKRELAERSGELLEELAHLKETEDLKRQEPISTGPFHELADEVSASIERISELGAQSDALGDEAETGTATIEDVDRASTPDLSGEARSSLAVSGTRNDQDAPQRSGVGAPPGGPS